VETGRPVPGSIFKQYMRYLNASVRSIVTEAGNKRCGDAGLPELSSILISVHCGTMHGLHSFSSYDLPRESYARDSRKRRRPVMIVKFAKCTEEVSRFHCRDMDSLEKRALLQYFFFLPIALRNDREYLEISTMIYRYSWDVCPWLLLLRTERKDWLLLQFRQ